jgi:hypothetical protein
MNNHLPFFLFFSLALLESMAIFYFILNLNIIRFSKKEFFIISASYPIVAFVVRSLPISFGIHSLILICLVSLFISYYYKIRLSSALLSMTLVMFILISVEFITSIFFTKVLAISFNEIISNRLFWFLSGLPHILLIGFLGYILKIIRR